MQKLNRILLLAPTETTGTPAFERAHALADATGARLHRVALDTVDPPVKVQARCQQRSGLQVTADSLESRSSLAQVLDYVNAVHADMVIKDIHYVPALGRAFHCPLDWLLLRDCPAHLHLVTEAKHPKPVKVLAAIDLSHLEQLSQGLNDRIVDLASTLAASCGAALHVLNVNSWVVMGASEHSVPTRVPTRSLHKSLRDAVRDAQDEALDLLAERYGIDKRQRHHLPGIPHQVISQFARQHAFDILVLGDAYQPAADRFIGSTVEGLLNHPPCSLVLVKPPG